MSKGIYIDQLLKTKDAVLWVHQLYPVHLS